MERIERRRRVHELRESGVSLEGAIRILEEPRDFVVRWWARETVTPKHANNRKATGVFDRDMTNAMIELHRLLRCSYEGMADIMSSWFLNRIPRWKEMNDRRTRTNTAVHTSKHWLLPQFSLDRFFFSKLLHGHVVLDRTRGRAKPADIATHLVRVGWEDNGVSGAAIQKSAWLLFFACRWDKGFICAGDGQWKVNQTKSSHGWGVEWHVFADKPVRSQVEVRLADYVRRHRLKMRSAGIGSTDVAIHIVTDRVGEGHETSVDIEAKSLNKRIRSFMLIFDPASKSGAEGIRIKSPHAGFRALETRLAYLLQGAEYAVKYEGEAPSYRYELGRRSKSEQKPRKRGRPLKINRPFS